jgi:hypothetical protein
VTSVALGALLLASGAQPRPAPASSATTGPAEPEPVARAVPIPASPVYVHQVASPATRGWRLTGDRRRVAPLRDELVLAYSFAVAVAPERCHLSLSLLAAIGQVESGNAAGHQLDAGHRVVPAIVGPTLDGKKFAAIPDTDGGTLDGDAVWDHAVGPFQFIPSSWRTAGVDLDGDGVRDPQDVYDAAGAAMVYVCAGDRDLDDPRQLESAVLAYNHSRSYLRAVQAWKAAFDADGLWSGPTDVATATAAAQPHVTRSASSAHAHQTVATIDAALPLARPLAPSGTEPAGPVVPSQPTPEEPTVPQCPVDLTAVPTGDPTADPTGDPTGDPTEDVVGEPPAEPPAEETRTTGHPLPPDPCAPVPDPGEPTEPVVVPPPGPHEQLSRPAS